MPRWNPAKSLARGKPDGHDPSSKAAREAASEGKKVEKPYKRNPNAKPINNQLPSNNPY